MLLLDTCAAIWLAVDQASLIAAARKRIEKAAAANQLFLSPITAWEIGLLASRGKLTLRQPLEIVIAELFDPSRVTIAHLSPDICWRSNFLPGDIHRDPADRLLIATAREMSLTLVTRDELILKYGTQGHVATIAC